jgi:hypothetical protein
MCNVIAENGGQIVYGENLDFKVTEWAIYLPGHKTRQEKAI